MYYSGRTSIIQETISTRTTFVLARDHNNFPRHILSKGWVAWAPFLIGNAKISCLF